MCLCVSVHNTRTHLKSTPVRNLSNKEVNKCESTNRLKTYTTLQCTAPYTHTHTHFIQHNTWYCIWWSHGVDRPIARGLIERLSVGLLCKCVQSQRENETQRERKMCLRKQTSALMCSLSVSRFMRGTPLPPLSISVFPCFLFTVAPQLAQVVTLNTLQRNQNNCSWYFKPK